MPWIRLLRGNIDAHSDKFLGHYRAGIAADHGPLGRGEVAHGLDRPEYIVPDAVTQNRIDLHVRKKNASLRRRRDSENGRRVVQREEDNGVVRPLIPLEMIDQAGSVGTELPDPLTLVVASM